MPRRKSISDEDILDRALPVIARAGPAGFTLADIATEIGLSPATLLQRFGDKKTLVERAFGRDNERFARWVADPPEGRGVAATLAVYRAATEAFHADPDPELAEHLLWLPRGHPRPDVQRAGASALRPARPVPGTAAGWSATHRPARKGTAACQNTPYTTFDPKGVLIRPAGRLATLDKRGLRRHQHRGRGRQGAGRQPDPIAKYKGGPTSSASSSARS
jgi:AcrR family transcriptional regulator